MSNLFIKDCKSSKIVQVNGASTVTLGTGLQLNSQTKFLCLGVRATFERAGEHVVDDWSAKSLLQYWGNSVGQWREAKNIWMVDIEAATGLPVAAGLLLDTGIAYECSDIVPIRAGDTLLSLDFDLLMFQQVI